MEIQLGSKLKYQYNINMNARDLYLLLYIFSSKYNIQAYKLNRLDSKQKLLKISSGRYTFLVAITTEQ